MELLEAQLLEYKGEYIHASASTTEFYINSLFSGQVYISMGATSVKDKCNHSIHRIGKSEFIYNKCQSTTLCIELHASLIHLQSSSAYSDALHTRLCMLCNSTLPLASAPLHMLLLLVCLFICLPLSSVKSNCTCSIRRGLGRRLRSSLLLNSSPRCNLPCRIAYLMF